LYPRSIESTYSGNVVSFSHTITGYTYLQQVDLLAGYASRNFVNTGSGFDKSTVTLPMGHVLSSLVIKVRNASSESTVSLSNISITGLYTAGDCQIAPKADGSDCTVTWTPTGDRLTDTDFYGGDILLKNIATGVDALDMFQEKLLIIPQAVNSDDITLNFTVTTGSGSANKIIKFNSTEVLTWQPGKKYTYTANITDNYITFKLTVNDWVEDDAIEL